MNLLVDTHCWLWSRAEPERLNKKARSLLISPENNLYFSAASSWEIAIKVAIGRLELPEDPRSYIPNQLAAAGFIAIPIEHAHSLHTATLPLHHGDPFDRLLVAQAQLEGFALMSADAALLDYDVELIWAGIDSPPRRKKR